MTPSTAVQTPIERPSIELAGVRIFASRDGDRVTGQATFPYAVAAQTSVEISYRNAPRSEISNLKSAPDSLDNQAQARLALVEEWRAACQMYPDIAKRMHAERVACGASIRCSPRSLQAWSRRLDIEGPAGLCDRYVPAPPAVLSLDPQTASDAILVCAWWSFRIANVERIDTPMMHSAAGLLHSTIDNRQSTIPVGDVLAAIDCYYSWPCDRQRYAFKPFVRWVRYDFETWLFRACDENDYRRECSTAAPGCVPLHSPQTIRWPDVPDPRSRKRDVYDRATRAAIASASRPTILELHNPSPLVAWLQSLDPRWRGFFLRVAKGDRHAKFELIATLRLWWDGLPESVRGEIDARIEPWAKDRSRTEVQISTRRVVSLIPRLRDIRRELTALTVAGRMVV